ncbi:hypothetical protein BDP27DRAFT_1328858 [Rhodocollybia butyracea]|uniref:Uncharacterized protein n=1 Tax=Rhodocollybia butyracea TaxID=206335 RepID=A0A9P5U5Z2_9AGAR|nr:hypothetical protein BDP27DRAFT_1328858 [Rhodocollybia butyracea]
MRINGELKKSQFYFTFTGPMCGGETGKCVARGMDFEKPTENAIVVGSTGMTLYKQGTPPGEFKPVYKVTYSPGGSTKFRSGQLKTDKLNIKAEVKFEEVQFTNYPPSVTEGELSFTFTGPMCGKQGGVCKARAKDLKAATEDAIIEGAKGDVLFKSGTREWFPYSEDKLRLSSFAINSTRSKVGCDG